MSTPAPFTIGQRVRVKAQCYHWFENVPGCDGSEGGTRHMSADPCEPWEGVVVGMRYRREGVVRSAGDYEDGWVPYLSVTKSHQVVLVTRGLWRTIIEAFVADVEAVTP